MMIIANSDSCPQAIVDMQQTEQAGIFFHQQAGNAMGGHKFERLGGADKRPHGLGAAMQQVARGGVPQAVDMPAHVAIGDEAFHRYYQPASDLIADICLSDDYTDFLTTPAYELVG